MKLPAPVPELPVTDIRAAASAYGRQMGFSLTWLNMASPAEVDQLHADRLRVFFDLGGSGA